ncbi:MAG TPA: DUF6262 family protein [Streptosporangiaceae bacterium]|jgi:hypothetical protein
MSTQPASPSPAAVRDACAQIAGTGKAVTFTAVAEKTGISRTTLYRRHDLRQLIEQHRETRRDDLSPAQLATQVSQLQQALEAVAATVRRHEEQLRALNRTRRAG